MKYNELALIFFSALAFIVIFGCAATYTVRMVDEDTDLSIPGISVDVLGDVDEGRFLSGSTDLEGEYEFKLADIPSDSFYIFVSEDDYFPLKKKLLNPDNNHVETVKLQKRVTIVSGYVLDDSTFGLISGCRIRAVPPISKQTATDENGKFVLKSDEFSEIEYTIFASRPDYVENSTTIRPKLNQKNDLQIPIYLTRIKQAEIEIKGKGIYVPLDPTRGVE